MRRFNEWLNWFRHPQAWGVYAALTRLPGFRPFEAGDGRIGIPRVSFEEMGRACPDVVTMREWVAFLRIISETTPDGGLHGLMESWALSGMAAGGVRVFCPTLPEADALSRVDINVRWPEYRQPYPAFVVAIPDGLFAGPVGEIGVPSACLLRHDPITRILASVTLGRPRTPGVINYHSWPEDGGTGDIEDHVKWVKEYGVAPGNVTEGEDAAADRCHRIAMNACLLLTNLGFRELGPANPDHARRLADSLKKKALPEAARRANERELRSMPVVYGIDQGVTVFRREDARPEPGEPTGSHVRPHWRRGHWARVACGAGRADRRLVFRHPVLVNAAFFGGTAADTRVVLKTAGAGE
jgi:hypothetical protein